MGIVRNGEGQSGHGTVKLTVSQEWIDGMNWFLHAGANSEKLKPILVGMVNGQCHLVHETLEFAV